jgi:hypothetical protein
MNKTILKSIGAVLAGFISVAVLSVATDALIERWGISLVANSSSHAMQWTLGFALFYRSVYTIIGGYITARLAPTSPMKHVVALMILGGLGGIGGVVNGWGYGNHWYPIALAVTGPVLVWVGGKMISASSTAI